MKRTHVAVAAGLLVVVVTAATIAGVAEFTGHKAGKWQGILTTQLSAAVHSTPARAKVLRTKIVPSIWESRCPDNPDGRSGWWYVEAGVEFKTGDSPKQVVRRISSQLAAKGWQRIPGERFMPDGIFDLVSNDLQLPEPSDTAAMWERPTLPGRSVLTVLLVWPNRTWMLAAQAQPPGFATPGC